MFFFFFEEAKHDLTQKPVERNPPVRASFLGGGDSSVVTPDENQLKHGSRSEGALG